MALTPKPANGRVSTPLSDGPPLLKTKTGKAAAPPSANKNGKPPKGAKGGATKGKPSPPPVAKTYKATACCEPTKTLPPRFVAVIRELEAELKLPVWLLIHGDERDEDHPFGRLDWPSFEVFRLHKRDIPNSPIALVVDSPGGSPDFAYQLAMTLRRRCGKFTAVVPRWAKSAATLLCLAAETIYLGEDAQLGPLDAQVLDRDKEERYTSALDDVGAIEELEEGAIGAAAASLFFMQQRTRKKLNVLMPFVFDFVAKLHQPLFDKIDAVKFSRMSRVLSVAEKYATILLQPRFEEQEAALIARDLVKRYPSHRYVIDVAEAKRIGQRGGGASVGLQIGKGTTAVNDILDDLYSLLGDDFKAVGRIVEAKS